MVLHISPSVRRVKLHSLPSSTAFKNWSVTRTVLFEHDNKNGYIQGFTENYVKVKVDYDPGLRNQSIKVKLNDFAEDGIIHGEILN